MAKDLPPIQFSHPLPNLKWDSRQRFDWDYTGDKLPPIQSEFNPNNQLPSWMKKTSSLSPLGTSPYILPDGDPYKYFIPGYQGFVPGSQFLSGYSYPEISRIALENFSRERTCARLRQFSPSTIYKVSPDLSISSPIKLKKERKIYPIESGIIPNYSGHIPGHKFRCGMTFGDITKNVREIKSME